MKTPATVAYWT